VIERSPKYNLSVLARYNLDLTKLGLGEWGTLSPQVQYQYQSRTYYRIFNIKDNSQPRFSLINLRLAWRSLSNRWTIEAFVNNVTDADVINFLTVGAGPELRAAYNRPRWLGFRFGFSY
jgi:iron complex outermembrane receptor protein